MFILWVLKQEGQTHGYRLIKVLQERTHGRWEPKSGTVYPILRKLESRGFIKSEWIREDGRKRRYYKITSTGSKALHEGMLEWKKTMLGFGKFLEELLGVG